MRGLGVVLVLVLGAGVVSGCQKAVAPTDVSHFADTAGELTGAAEYCAPVMAARATACARHVVATWPGGLDDGERLDALERLEVARLGAASQPQSCPAALQKLRAETFWERCYVRG